MDDLPFHFARPHPPLQGPPSHPSARQVAPSQPPHTLATPKASRGTAAGVGVQLVRRHQHLATRAFDRVGAEAGQGVG